MTDSRISVKCRTQSDRKQKVWFVLFTNHKICFTLLRCLYVPHLLQGALICFTCSNSLYHCGLIWFWIGVTGAPRRLYFYACTPLAFLFGACDWCLVLKCGKKCKFTNIERNSEKPVGWFGLVWLASLLAFPFYSIQCDSSSIWTSWLSAVNMQEIGLEKYGLQKQTSKVKIPLF